MPIGAMIRLSTFESGGGSWKDVQRSLPLDNLGAQDSTIAAVDI